MTAWKEWIAGEGVTNDDLASLFRYNPRPRQSVLVVPRPLYDALMRWQRLDRFNRRMASAMPHVFLAVAIIIDLFVIVRVVTP